MQVLTGRVSGILLGFKQGARVSMYKGEKFNSISHVVGAALALAGLAVLVVLASLKADPWKIVSFSVYGTTLVLLYTCSALYHSFRGKAKDIFRKLDHCMIYLLIAGTYTPITLVTLREQSPGWGWSIFGVVWGLAVFGIVWDTVQRRGARILPVVIYLLMGWLIVIALKPMSQELEAGGFALLIAGGLAYTLGVIFYAMDTKIRHFHGVWHLFVLAGSISHFLAVLLYIL
jgi:hemolysin III